MVWFLFFCFGALFGAMFVSLSLSLQEQDSEEMMQRGLIGFGVLAFFVLFLAWLSYYTVPAGHRGVIVRNDAVVGMAEPGLGFKVPFIDTVHDMSVQTQKLQFEQISSYSRDIQLSESVATLNFHLAPDSVLAVYETIGLSYGECIVWPAMNRRFKEAFGQFAAADIVNQRDRLGDLITATMQEDLAPHGIIVEAVQIENIDFSDNYEKAIEAAAHAEADVKRARQELEQVKVNAQRQIAEAEAKAIATRTTADAEAYAVKVRGEGEAAAIAARGKALKDNPQLVELIAAEKWDGTLPTTMVPNGTLPFLNLRPAAVQ